MKKFFDKTKCYNYIIAGIFLITAMMFIKNMASFVWNFDMTNRHQLTTFLKNIVNGRAFLSGKQLSFLITFVGSVCVAVSGCLIAMQIKFTKSDENNIENNTENSVDGTENTADTSKVSSKTDEKENTVAKVTANTKVEAKPEEAVTETKPAEEMENPQEARFAMYNKNENTNTNTNTNANTNLNENTNINANVNSALPTQEIKVETPENIGNSENFENTQAEDEERARLQAKIKEIMKKMKEKQEIEEASSENKPTEKLEKIEEKTTNPEKLLSKVEFSKPLDAEKVEKIDMNFKNISEEENSLMEQIIISAGFKLLSEIRIGSTGVDYLGVAKDKIAVIQLDTTGGNWFASEDKVEGNETPVWFSEEGNKISPVFRALEAKSNIQKLLSGNVDLPIETIACITNSNVVNYSEFEEKWNELGVKVVRLNENEEDNVTGIKTISDIYPIQSQEEISEPEMNKIISILEKAEIPE